MLSFDQALEHVRRAAGGLVPRPKTIPLDEALGRVLAAPVHMDHDVPPFDRATMDGFALRAADLAVGVRLPVAGVIAAGDAPGADLPAGAALRIMTGAPLPAAADFVVPFEWTQSDGDGVTINEVGSGPNIARQGAHTRSGDVVAAAGQVVTPGLLGALASAGASTLQLCERPRIAILGTGSELVPIDAEVGPGRIRNSNASALYGQALRVLASPLDLGFASDDEDRLRAKVHQGLAGDVLLLSGGVSKGDFDLVPQVLAAEGVVEVFHGWAVQPGGPLWFGTHKNTLVFGLPGNPAATFVAFELIVVPALRALLGLEVLARPIVRARYTDGWDRPSQRRRFRPVTLRTEDDGQLVAEALPWRGSGSPFAFGQADGLVAIPEGAAAAEPGTAVLEVVPISDAGWLWGRA